MGSGLDFYKKDTAYRIMRKELAAKYGKQKTERIWKRAGKYLERLYEKFDDVPKAQRMHTHNEIFPRIAMYRAIQKELPDEAMDIMDWAVEYTGKRLERYWGRLHPFRGCQGYLCVYLHGWQRKCLVRQQDLGRYFIRQIKRSFGLILQPAHIINIVRFVAVRN